MPPPAGNGMASSTTHRPRASRNASERAGVPRRAQPHVASTGRVRVATLASLCEHAPAIVKHRHALSLGCRGARLDRPTQGTRMTAELRPYMIRSARRHKRAANQIRGQGGTAHRRVPQRLPRLRPRGEQAPSQTRGQRGGDHKRQYRHAATDSPHRLPRRTPAAPAGGGSSEAYWRGLNDSGSALRAEATSHPEYARHPQIATSARRPAFPTVSRLPSRSRALTATATRAWSERLEAAVDARPDAVEFSRTAKRSARLATVTRSEPIAPLPVAPLSPVPT